MNDHKKWPCPKECEEPASDTQFSKEMEKLVRRTCSLVASIKFPSHAGCVENNSTRTTIDNHIENNE